MISGARQARPNFFRRLVARAQARELHALVVPGPESARAAGVDLEAAGLTVSDTPRHASVLVLVGELPPVLKKAAAVAYAQMPRPRAILATGAGDISPLPEPDVTVRPTQEDITGGVTELRRLFAQGAFSPEAVDFDVDLIRTQTEYVCPMHPEVVRSEPGSCPICGMDLVPREASGGNDHGAMDHGGDGTYHESMDHGDMGFMSMVEMTEGLPRSSDGLQMEWVESVPFGPLFPGLPGGLTLKLTLDGDTVARAEAEGIVGRASAEDLAGPAETLPDRLARLDPLSPVAYRVLASRALESAAGVQPDERTVLARVGALEKDRAASHLGWLSIFARLIGYPWLENRASKLQLALVRTTDADEITRPWVEAGRIARRIEKTPLLRRKLGNLGLLPEGSDPLGPVARARSVAEDARAGEKVYRSLGFQPVLRDGDDAFSRLRVRLAEVEQSLDLIQKAGEIALPEPTTNGGSLHEGSATVETPRGAATLRLRLEEETIVSIDLDTPSAWHLGLVGGVTEQRELADALVGVASLDLSPWDVVR